LPKRPMTGIRKSLVIALIYIEKEWRALLDSNQRPSA
jgi:hypothetical protein